MEISKLKDLKLYSYFRSSASWRVRIVLNLKKIDYEIIPIDLIKDGGQQKTSDYEKINPMKHVPALVVDGKIITESVAICEFLDECDPDHKLIPKDPILRAQVRAFCEVINAGTQPLVNLKIRQKVQSFGQDPAAWCKQYGEEGLQALEKLLEKSQGKYCFGDELTMADVFIVPGAKSLVRWGINLKDYPNIHRVVSELEKMDAFVKAEPDNQPDAEK